MYKTQVFKYLGASLPLWELPVKTSLIQRNLTALVWPLPQGVQDPRCSTQALVFSVQTRQCQGRGEHLLLKPCPSFFDKCIKRENGVPSGFPTQQWDSSFCLHQSEHGSHPQSSPLYLFCSYLMEKIIPLGHLACNQTSEALVKNKIFLWWSP